MQEWEKGGILRNAHEKAVHRLNRYGFSIDECPSQYEVIFMSELRRLKKMATRKLVTEPRRKKG